MIGLQNYSAFQPIAPRKSIEETLRLVETLGRMGDQKNARIANAQAIEAAQIQAQQSALKQAELRAALDAAHKSPTAENYMRLSDLHAQYDPDKAKAFRDNWEVLDSERQQSTFRDSVSMLAALEINPEVGIKAIQEQIRAAENVGDKDSVKKYKALLEMVQTGDKGVQSVKDSLITIIGMMPNGKDAIGNVIKFAEERRAAAAEPDAIDKRLADLDYTKAQTDKIRAELNKMDREAADALIRLEEGKVGELYDPKDIESAENTLRKEYDAKQTRFNQIRNYYDIIANAEKTSIGDVALIYTYMKILDPTSVVREGEVATAANAGGIPSGIMAAYNQALGSGKIDDKVRNQINSQSRVIFNKAKEQEALDKDFYTGIAKRRGLNVENIIYSPPPAQSAAAPKTEEPTVYPNTFEGAMAFARDKWKDRPEYLKELDAIKTYAELEKQFGKTLTAFKEMQGAVTATTAQKEVTGSW